MEKAYIIPINEEGVYEIRLFENQKYRFFRGWGNPSENSTDPSHISYVDGPSSMFPNLESVECPAGWKWKSGSEWTINYNYTSTNPSGWCYATSFARMGAGKQSDCDIFKFYTINTEVLGKGAFSEVRSGVHISSGMPVAIKCLALAKLSKKDEKDVAMEIELLREVQHPHVVKLFDDYRDKHFIYMVLEVIQGGELFDWIVSREYFLEEEARDLMYTLLQTIAHLHYRHIVHRDIKPENILMVDKTANSSVKLTDFGFAARCPNDHCLREACGSPSYVAPEVLKRVPYGRPADVWSLGVVGYILLCGYTPFDASSDKEMFELTKRGQYQFHSDAWDMISDEAKDLISHLLVVNPESRFTARQALDHPWFARAGLKTRSLDITLVNLKKFQALKKFRVAGKAVLALRRFSAPMVAHQQFEGVDGEEIEAAGQRHDDESSEVRPPSSPGMAVLDTR